MNLGLIIGKTCLTLAALTALLTTTQAQLLVNEFDYAQPGVDDKEFIELYVSADDGVDLGEYSIELVDGVTGVAYASIVLNPVSLAQGDYYVICGSMATTPNCDQVAGTAIDFIQNGEPDAIAVVRFGQIIDTISYAGDSVPPYTEGQGTIADDGSEDGLGLSRSPNGMDFDFSRFEFGLFCVSPGAANTNATAPCDGVYEIHEIQGDGLVSPVEGVVVETQGNIVTAVRSNVAFNGFYMEAPSARRDNDTNTSEGIFVRTINAPLVQEGDEVNVIGTVSESVDMTMLSNSPSVAIISQGNPLPPPVTFDGLTPAPDQPVSAVELERFEGMRVAFSGIAVGPSQGSTFVKVVATMNRTFREPGIAYPGEPGLPVWDDNPEVFSLLIETTPFANERIFAGQIVDVEGNLRELSAYYVQPTSLTLGPEPALPRAVRARQGNEIIVASQNMTNFFDAVDDPDTADVVVSEASVEQRLVGFSNHIRNTLQAPDIVALQDVETLDLVQRTANRIALDDPSLNYSAHLIDGPDQQGLNVAYLTRDDTVTALSLTALGVGETDFAGFPLNWRPPLMLDAVYEAGGSTFALTVINVQQDPLSVFEFPIGARQRRFEQSISLAEKIQALQVSPPELHLLLLGDIGANEFSDGFVDVLGQISGAPDPLGAEYGYVDIVSPSLVNHAALVTAAERYSIILSGNSQLSDHILTNENLSARVNHFAFSRGNADAPTRPDANGNPSPRVADQDAPVIYLAPLADDTDGDGIDDDSDNCTLLANPGQRDTDADGIGNLCDPDVAVPNDCIVNSLDLMEYKANFFQAGDLDTDNNGDGFTGFADLVVVRQHFFGPPGPSATGCN